MGATIISLDGLPGAGKSWLLKQLKQHISNVSERKVICLQEPVKEWSKLIDSLGNTLFSLYYQNQSRYSLAFQLQVLHTRFELFEKTIREYPDAIIITERDIVTDCEVFTKMLYDDGKFQEIEFLLYRQLFNSYLKRLKQMCSESEYRVWLDVSPAVCMGRIAKRGRKEEKTITMTYLENLERYHKEAFSDIDGLLKIDCEEEWDSIPINVLKRIVRFVNVVTDNYEKFEISK